MVNELGFPRAVISVFYRPRPGGSVFVMAGDAEGEARRGNSGFPSLILRCWVLPGAAGSPLRWGVSPALSVHSLTADLEQAARSGIV